ncbi:biopolymer transporter ExbD [Prevotella sp. A2931]|uniref:Biopolymer transporter ExbD n=2 Tax=Prevotellaceae TaxID=171552 RepID=A0ABS3M858_9BACT|nr:biopolymer transporter ExbD [Prevotella sp. oral taxon 820]MBO1364372.1 biopolymer transporter ExbD [Prevotella illustrans]PTL27293.1 hypothetical protein C3V39_02880 [Prevotella sp. oral taxon 820]
MFRKRNRRVPGLNTTSTADISFMLLIFFLVASSMDIDKGLTRQLPPMETKQEQKATEVNRQKLLQLRIDAADQLLVDDKVMPMNQLQGRVEEFLQSLGADHLIVVAADPASSYDCYFQLQNSLVAAHQHWRDRMARKIYGRGFRRLATVERDNIRERCPLHVTESIPENTKGGDR